MKRKRDATGTAGKKPSAPQPYIEIGALTHCDLSLLNAIIKNSSRITDIFMPQEQLSEMVNIEDVKTVGFTSQPTIKKFNNSFTEYRMVTLPQYTFSSHLCHLYECR